MRSVGCGTRQGKMFAVLQEDFRLISKRRFCFARDLPFCENGSPLTWKPGEIHPIQRVFDTALFERAKARWCSLGNNKKATPAGRLFNR